jgi:hypothetical protein
MSCELLFNAYFLCECMQVLRESNSRAVYDHQLSQAELKATVTLHDEIDLEDMDEQELEQQQQQQQQASSSNSHQQQQEQQEQQDGQGLAAAAAGCVRSYPCRCGDSYLLRPADLQLAAQEIILPCR